MSTSRRLMMIYTSSLALLVALFTVVSMMLARNHSSALVIPDEKAAAAALLSKKLTGPRYFQAPPGDARDDSGIVIAAPAEVHISIVAARSQVDRLVKERNLQPEEAANLRQLIDHLLERPNSRVVGEDHVNLLRLNLALDSLAASK